MYSRSNGEKASLKVHGRFIGAAPLASATFSWFAMPLRTLDHHRPGAG
jgi:hypothetical protein